MKKKVLALLVLSNSLLYAQSINELFEALKKSPAGVEDALKLEEARSNKNFVDAALYPKLYGFASYEHYSNPTNIRPLLPSESAELLKQANPTIPFSQNLKKVGAKLSMPIFNSSLYAAMDETRTNLKSAQAKRKLDGIAKEAVLIENNSMLAFVERLIEAANSKKASVSKTKERISVGVKNGKYAAADELRLQNALGAIDILLSDAAARSNLFIQNIYALTNVSLQKSAPMRLKEPPKTEDLSPSLEPLAQNEKAKEYALKAAHRTLYPALFLDANIFRGYGEAYNNNDSFQRDYGAIGVYLSIPIFDDSLYKNSQKARVAALSAKNALEKTKLELEAKARTLKGDKEAIEKELASQKEIVAANEKLLEVAKVAYKNGRLSVEEYLRYEDALFDSKANAALLEANGWKVIGLLSLLYGQELSDIVE